MADGTSNHLISLKDTEIFDCKEKEYFSRGLSSVMRRIITRKFDFNLAMRAEKTFKRIFSISSGNILMKMTGYNLKTLMEVAEYQELWEKETSGRYLNSLDPSEVKPNEIYNISLGTLSFIYIDNFKSVFLPVLRFDMKLSDWRIENNDTRQITAYFEIVGKYNNSRTSQWELFLEPLNLDVNLSKIGSSTSVVFSSENDGILLNFTEELLEVLLHCSRNFKSLVSKSISPSPESTIEESTETIICDSQFLIRNSTGYDIIVRTVGDQTSSAYRISSTTEKFVSFIVRDEFKSNKNTVRRVLVNVQGFEASNL